MITDTPVDRRRLGTEPPADTTSSTPPAEAGAGDPPAASAELGVTMGRLLAALSVGAAVIHLVMVPQHTASSFRMGLAFAVAGWFQIAFALAMVARPTRRWAQLGLVANVALIGAWAWSRTSGLPPWTGAAGVEPVAAVDVFCVALEIAVVLGAAVSLLAPNLLRTPSRSGALVTAIVPLAVLVATTALLVSPQTANHAHGGADHPDHPDQTATAATTAAAAAGTTTAAGHDHGAQPPGASTGPGSPGTLPATSHHHGAAAEDGADARHHGESEVMLTDLPAATRAEVDQVIAGWASRYPTGGDALKDGWFKATPNLYGIGSHYLKDLRAFSGSEAVPFDMMQPTILLYDGEGPDAKFAGVSYVVQGGAEGFTGDFDFWHEHDSVCLHEGKVTLTEEGSKYWYSERECRAIGGRVLPIAGDLMIHLWIGPGYTDAPIFAHDNPEIYDGYYPKQQP